MDGSGRCPANSSYSILRYKEHKRVEQNDKEVRVACARGIDKEREIEDRIRTISEGQRTCLARVMIWEYI